MTKDPLGLTEATIRASEQLANIASVSYIEAVVVATAYARCLARLTAATADTEEGLTTQIGDLHKALLMEARSAYKAKLSLS